MSVAPGVGLNFHFCNLKNNYLGAEVSVPVSLNANVKYESNESYGFDAADPKLQLKAKCELDLKGSFRILLFDPVVVNFAKFTFVEKTLHEFNIFPLITDIAFNTITNNSVTAKTRIGRDLNAGFFPISGYGFC